MQEGLTVIHCKLIAKQSGKYTTYVFQNLDQHGYVMCTRCPNWDGIDPNVGTEGYLSYQFVQAGLTTWYDKVEAKFVPYAYTAFYFVSFVEKPRDIDPIKI